jgi:hypothetical protein
MLMLCGISDGSSVVQGVRSPSPVNGGPCPSRVAGAKEALHRLLAQLERRARPTATHGRTRSCGYLRAERARASICRGAGPAPTSPPRAAVAVPPPSSTSPSSTSPPRGHDGLAMNARP